METKCVNSFGIREKLEFESRRACPRRPMNRKRRTNMAVIAASMLAKQDSADQSGQIINAEPRQRCGVNHRKTLCDQKIHAKRP